MEEVRVPKLRKLKDIWKVKANKYFLGITFCFGILPIVVSIICRGYGRDGIWIISVSLMENMGAALLIPAFLVWLQRAVSGGLRSDRPVIKEYLRSMRAKLRMLGISLYDVHEKRDEFNAYLKKALDEPKGLFGKRKDPFKFTFLLMDPSSPFLELRAKEEDKRLERFLEEIMDTIKELKEFKNRVEREPGKVGSFSVHIYDAPATHSFIWVDETMYVGPYFRGQAGYKTLWVEVSSRDKELYQELSDDFDELLDREGTRELKEKKDFEEEIKKVEKLLKDIKDKEKEVKDVVG
ncbi:MAG TPA: hypothetical protein VMW67_03270 [Desulfobacteria bacterium]|nr:hypothetical protein [Desulfobacteria bacterium]